MERRNSPTRSADVTRNRNKETRKEWSKENLRNLENKP